MVQDLGLYLSQHTTLGAYGGQNGAIFAFNMPNLPDVCVALYETPGLPASPNQTDAGTGYSAIAYPRLQLASRAGAWDYATARANIETARAALCAIRNQQIGAYRYLAVYELAGITTFERDERERPSATLELEIHRAGAPT